MITLVFVGSAPAGFLDTPYMFKRFGQVVEIPDDLAARAVAENVALVTQEEFANASFTPTQLTKYGKFESHAVADQDFLTKRDALWETVRSRTEFPAAATPALQAAPLTPKENE